MLIVSVIMFLCMFLMYVYRKPPNGAINSCFICRIGKTLFLSQDLTEDIQTYKLADSFLSLGYMGGNEDPLLKA